MSIWCSLPVIGFDSSNELDEPIPSNNIDEPSETPEPTNQVRSYATGWSNHYPSTDGSAEREASLNLAYIPAWCAGGDDDDYRSVGQWLRLGLRSHTHNFMAPTEVVARSELVVVMDEGAVRALVDNLTAWLERPKVTPEHGAH